jgi:hypothetical protein
MKVLHVDVSGQECAVFVESGGPHHLPGC